MLSMFKDWHQTLSWKAGRRDGKKSRLFHCPWWADDRVYALAYMQAKGIEIPKAAEFLPRQSTHS